MPSIPWSSVAPALPSEIATAASALSDAAGLARTGLQTARAAMVAQTALVSGITGGALSGAQQALDGAVGALETAVAGLLNDAGGYVLIVPLPKKGLAYYLPAPLTLPAPPAVGGAPFTTRALPVWRRAFDDTQLFTGGNAHFLRTVSTSLTDAGDGARPQFTRTSYWGYAAFVAGATDITAAMSVAAYVDQLFRRDSGTGAEQVTSGSSDMDIVATGLVARASTNGTLVTLEWSPLTSRPIGDDWVCAPWKYAVIRSSSPEAMTARRILDLFSTLELSEGLEGRFGAKVLKLAPYIGIIHRYVDEEELIEGTTYYYHLAVRTRAEGPGGQKKEWPFNLLSSAARYQKQPRPTPQGRRGVPPDWYRTPSLLHIIPPLGRLSDRLLTAVGSLRASTTQTLGYAQAALDALDRTINRLTRILGELDQLVSQLNAVYATPNANIHVVFSAGQGNTTTLVSDLAARLSDMDDPNRPPFDGGDEYVCGVITVVTSPDASEFEALWARLQTLFNFNLTADPILAGIESVQGALGVVRETLTDADPALTFNENLTPRPPGEGDFTCE